MAVAAVKVFHLKQMNNTNNNKTSFILTIKYIGKKAEEEEEESDDDDFDPDEMSDEDVPPEEYEDAVGEEGEAEFIGSDDEIGESEGAREIREVLIIIYFVFI